MNHNSGFTLVELSVVLIIIALIVGMTAASGVTIVSAARYSSTISKMAALDQALMAFRVANNRIPCPADLSQVQGSVTYGTEGSCAAIAGGVFVAQNSGGTATAAEGGVPTAALGLPGDFMYDGWGNRFRYAVDTRMTSYSAFSLMQIGCTNGAITVYGGPSYPAIGNTARTTGAIYSLISHGANGHGGVTKNAVVTDAGSLNNDEQTNCHCTSTGAAGTYAPTYVQLPPYTYQAIIIGCPSCNNSHYNFDDIVSYKERWQMQTTWDKVGTNCAGGAYSRAITIDYTKVSTANHTSLTNFPMLFSGTYSYLATTANGGNVTNANGYDITFTSDAAGNNLLPFERESYNASTGAVNFWVQVPTVSGTANTIIYLWYDNPDITTDQSNVNGTWDSNYAGVWHMNQDPSGTAPQEKDSTSNGYNGTSQGSMTSGALQAAKIGNGLSFNGTNQYLNIGNITQINSVQNISYETWVKFNSLFDLEMIMDAKNSATAKVLMRLCSTSNGDGANNTNICIKLANGTDVWGYTTSNFLSTGNWYHAVMVFDGTQSTNATRYKLYINGVQQALSYNGTIPSTSASNVGPLYFGNENTTNSYYINGLLDEARVSNSSRSADWIVTEYNNQSSPNTFYTIGSAISR